MNRHRRQQVLIAGVETPTHTPMLYRSGSLARLTVGEQAASGFLYCSFGEVPQSGPVKAPTFSEHSVQRRKALVVLGAQQRDSRSARAACGDGATIESWKDEEYEQRSMRVREVALMVNVGLGQLRGLLRVCRVSSEMGSERSQRRQRSQGWVALQGAFRGWGLAETSSAR